MCLKITGSSVMILPGAIRTGEPVFSLRPGDRSHELQYCLPYFSSASAQERYNRPRQVMLRSHSPDIEARKGPLN